MGNQKTGNTLQMDSNQWQKIYNILNIYNLRDCHSSLLYPTTIYFIITYSLKGAKNLLLHRIPTGQSVYMAVMAKPAFAWSHASVTEDTVDIFKEKVDNYPKRFTLTSVISMPRKYLSYDRGGPRCMDHEEQ